MLHGETDLAWLCNDQLETQDRPLTIIRRSSQVCRKWRDIILGSPLLWGKLLDMSLLSELARGHWMNEVVRRSGRSPLHITTDNEGVSRRLSSLVTLLDDHWERVQVLNVILKVWVSTDTIRSEISQILRRPTSCLRSFKLDFISDTGYYPELGPEPPLFGNAAPALIALRCTHPFLNLGSTNLWLSQLRVLHITLDTRTYNVPALLEAFKRIPGLEILMLGGWQLHTGSPSVPHKSVALPNLKVLRLLTVTTTTMTEILDALVLPDVCSLVVFARRELEDFVRDNLTHTYQTLHRYSRNYFNTHTITSLLLSITSNTLLLQDTSMNHGPGVSRFSLDLRSDAEFLGGELSLFFDLFADANLAKTTYITLDIGPSHDHLSESNFMSLLHRLDSVEALDTSEPTTTLQFLSIDLHRNAQRIYFFSTPTTVPQMAEDENVLIDEIDLRNLDYDSSPQDLDLLEEMTGLFITWDTSTASDDEELICEYLCGSGNPEMLRDIFPIDNTM
ncbi:hypothetical protein GALMADRAFT_146224 [Galerina marginata CBS 339.88]|uniref:F-box domain-containing protein n=1 Tax=Galerina marginata (strain CBS 339.88) TaxID=685588 RepID=A0A067SCB4_GALM3|nr:hypothetical protein GALMADRAFT_146224 [Galerina marginata CBS 339.88]